MVSRVQNQSYKDWTLNKTEVWRYLSNNIIVMTLQFLDKLHIVNIEEINYGIKKLPWRVMDSFDLAEVVAGDANQVNETA